jgi:hypothetical protein
MSATIAVQPGGLQTKVVLEEMLGRAETTAIKDAQALGRRRYQERMIAVRQAETEDSQRLTQLRARHEEFTAKADGEQRQLSKAKADVSRCIRNGKDPTTAAAKVDSYARTWKQTKGWLGELDAEIKTLAARMEKERAAELVRQREDHARQAEIEIADFQARLVQFLAENAPPLAEAQAAREAVAVDRRADWRPPQHQAPPRVAVA